MTPTVVWLRLLNRDIVWGRFSPSDVSMLQWSMRRIVTRAEGMNIYFTLIDPTRERFPVTPAPTTPNTPAMTRTPTPVASRSSSPTRGRRDRSVDKLAQVQTRDSVHSMHRRRGGGASSPLHAAIARHLRHLSGKHSHGRHHHREHHDNHLHLSLLEMAHSLSTHQDTESAVGVFESQRYVNLEMTRLSHGQSSELTAQFTELLGESCDDLLGAAHEGVLAVKMWVTGVRRADFGGKSKVEKMREERVQKLENVRDELHRTIEAFRNDKRSVA